MPCGGCKPTESRVIALWPFLDAAEHDLHEAGIFEVQELDREHIGSLIEIIRAIRKRAPVSVVPDWGRLRVQAEKSVQLIQCQYCRKHTYLDLVASIDVAYLNERGAYWCALKLSVKKDLEKYGWLAVAFWYRLLKPKMLTHIQWCTRKLRHPLKPL